MKKKEEWNISIKNKKGFTLIELIAVLVILAILALIVTPLILNIIRKARTAADKRSIDAYGRSIEIAIAGYLLDNGTFPTSIDQLTIEYSGDQVVCSTTKINSDSSVYLAGCTVAGRSTGDYTYGTKEEVTYDYRVGDLVTYNNVDYRVIKNSSASESTVTLLKAEPLSVEEVNIYGGVGTANNHVNMYTSDSSYPDYRTASNENGYGGMAYYSSANCGYGQDSNHTESGCTRDYAQSEVKYVVDAWKNAKAPAATEARLLTYDELINNLGYDPTISSSGYPQRNDNVPNWVYNSNYEYCTSSQSPNSSIGVWYVGTDGSLATYAVYQTSYAVRPVITLSKTNISS